MDSLIILGIGLTISAVALSIAILGGAYLWMQTTIYRQGQINYRAAIKAQTAIQTGNIQPHQGSDGGIFSELMPLIELASRPDMQPLIEKFLKRPANTGTQDLKGDLNNNGKTQE